MTEALSFPGLGLQFEINRVAFTVGDRPIYWYGIIIAAAFLIGAIYIMNRRKKFGLDGDRVMDVVLGGVLLGIVGARIYYVLFSWATYRDNPVSVFYIWEGGIAIYGGIIGGVIGAMLMCKWRKVKLLPLLDLVAGGLLLGQAIGRWGNFVNMEAFGRNTDAAWGMTGPSIVWYLKNHVADLTRIGVAVDPAQPVHPTFLYESMWCLLGFLFIVWFTSRRRFDGELALIYLGWYGLGRFYIEGLRTDSLLLGTMRVSQVLALVCVIISVFVLTIILSKIRRANDPEYMPLFVNTDEGKAVLSGEFYKKKDGAEAETSEDITEDIDEASAGDEVLEDSESDTGKEEEQDESIAEAADDAEIPEVSNETLEIEAVEEIVDGEID